MSNFLVFKQVVPEMDLTETLLVNGDVPSHLRIVGTEHKSPEGGFGIHNYVISYKKVDKEIANQLAIDRAMEQVEKVNQDLARDIRDGKKNVPNKLKQFHLESVILELLEESPVITKRFEFYVGEDFILVPKFAGKTIIEEEYLVPFVIKEPSDLLDKFINKGLLELGGSSGQILDNGISAVIHSNEKIGKVFAGKVSCITDGITSYANVTLEPKFSAGGKFLEVISVIQVIISKYKEATK